LYIVDYTIVNDTLEDNYLFTNNDTNPIMIDDSNVTIQNHDMTTVTNDAMGNIQTEKEIVDNNKQKNSTNKKYHMIFKPKLQRWAAPIIPRSSSAPAPANYDPLHSSSAPGLRVPLQLRSKLQSY